ACPADGLAHLISVRSIKGNTMRPQLQTPDPVTIKAAFLDRDGVINENRSDHVRSWAQFRFLPGAPQAVARLSEAGVQVFVITNQAIINRGMVSRSTVDRINRRMVAELREVGGRVDAVAYCPHRPDEGCACRKPRPGLILKLAQRYGVDLRLSVMIGDALSDVEAARAAGCSAILVLTGRGRAELELARDRRAEFTVASDLGAAIDGLLTRTTARV
ncbi:MAG TPA: HAD family hydrolase, partial [Chloroflexota bacterium]|nr:HAD family hydrolase [Chloroflexota bacterium]